MKLFENRYFKAGLTVFLTSCAIVIFSFMVYHISSILAAIAYLLRIVMPILIGIVLAYLLSPIINWLEKKLFGISWFYKRFFMEKEAEQKAKVRRIVRVFSIILVYLILFALIVALFGNIIPQLIESIQNIVKQLPQYWDNLQKTAERLLKRYPELESSVISFTQEYSVKIDEWVNDWTNSDLLEKLQEILNGNGDLLTKISGVFSSITSGAFSVLRMLLNFIIGIIVSIYLLNSKELFIGQCKKIAYALLSRDRANALIHNLRFMNKTFMDFFGGKVVDSLIIGMLCYILTKILGTPYAFLISLIVGITNIIPYFGPFIGAIPSALLVLMVDPKKCLSFVIMILILQQFDGNILGPKILGQKTGLSSFWVIFAITIGGGLFGPIGMLLGVPIFAVIYASIVSAMNKRLRMRRLTTVSKKYVHVDYIDENDKMVKLPKEKVTNVVSRFSFKELINSIGAIGGGDTEESPDADAEAKPKQ